MNILNHPRTCVLMLLGTSWMAFLDSRDEDVFGTYAMIVCAAWWMFRVWGHIRQENAQ